MSKNIYYELLGQREQAARAGAYNRSSDLGEIGEKFHEKAIQDYQEQAVRDFAKAKELGDK